MSAERDAMTHCAPTAAACLNELLKVFPAGTSLSLVAIHPYASDAHLLVSASTFADIREALDRLEAQQESGELTWTHPPMVGDGVDDA